MAIRTTERERLLTAIHMAAHPLHVTTVETAEYTLLSLPRSPNGEVNFDVYLYPDGEPQLAAGTGDSAASKPMWAMAFEPADFTTVEEMHDAFLKALRIVLTCRTRIVRNRSWPLRESKCEYWVGDRWLHLGGMSFLKGAEPPGWDRDDFKEILTSEPVIDEPGSQ